MNLDQLRSFLMVAKCGSFSKAAEALYLSQPAVSVQIETLEREQGVKLFDRLGKRVVLTEAGEIVHASAEGIFRQLEEMQQKLADLGDIRRGRLKLGASLIVGIYILPEVLGRFKRRFPSAELTLKIEYADKIIESILNNQIDLGLVSEGAPIKDSRISVTPFLTDELILVSSAQHAFVGQSQVSLAQLAEQPFIISEEGSATRELIKRRIEEAGGHLSISMELGNIEAIKKAVEVGLGVSIMSRCAVLREVQNHRLYAYHLEGISFQRNISLIQRKGRQMSKLMQAFVEDLPQQCGSEIWQAGRNE